MKGLYCRLLIWGHGDLKKSLAKIRYKDGFFGPVALSTSRLIPFFRYVAGALRSGIFCASPYAGVSAAFLLALVERT